MSTSLTEDGVARQLDNCTYCPKMCRHACPVSTATGHEPLIPQQKMHRLNQLRRGQKAWTRDNTAPLYACTGCRQCTVYCEHDNEPGLVLLAGRVQANERNAGHDKLANYPERFRNRDERLAKTLRESVPPGKLATDAVIGFLPGCDAIDKNVNGAEQAVDVFESVGADHVRFVDADQVCGGYPLLAAGFPDMFRWHATKMAASLKGFRTVVIGCSACLYTLRVSYPAEGLTINAELVSTAEYLAQQSSSIEEPAEKKPVYYHDPCYLARYTGVLEEPRRVLSRIAEVREFSWSRADTECCGGAGLVPKTMPEAADQMARYRLRDVAQRGGGTVVTACPTCTFMLKRNAPDGVEVKGLLEFVSQHSRGAGGDFEKP